MFAFSSFHKKLFLAYLLAHLFLFSGCYRMYPLIMTDPTPKLVSINIIDRNGLTEIVSSKDRLEQYENVNFLEPQPYQKVLRVYSRDSQGNIRAFITSYHPNGLPKQYLEVMNSRAHGAYREWHPNGTLRIDAYVVNGTADIVNDAEQTWAFDGECIVQNDKGEKEASFFYDKGDLEGIATYYHPNGMPWKLIPYHQNKIEGSLKTYLENGELLQQIDYCNGVREGASLRYWEDGKLSTEEFYSEGFLAKGRYYDPSGALISQVDEGNGYRALFSKDALCELQQCKGGVLEGEVKIFDERNRLASLFHIKEGLKHGEEICYYTHTSPFQKHIPKILLTWYEGKIQGTVKTWYDNGVQESQKEMSNNKKNGHSTVWYRNGNLMMIEEYESEKLIKGEYYSKDEKLLVGEVRHGKGTSVIFDAEGTLLRKINYENGMPQIER